MKVVKLCATPGAIYHIQIHSKEIGCRVALPITLNLNERQAIQLENRIHDAMEQILKEYFNANR